MVLIKFFVLRSFFNECSHILMILMDFRRKFLLTRLARSRLRSNFVLQNADLVWGICPHEAQPCQKHPSTKIANFFLVKNMSGFPNTSGGCKTHPFIPALTNAILNFNSVDLLCFPLMALMILERSGETLEKTPLFNLSLSFLSIGDMEILRKKEVQSNIIY